MTAPDTDTTSTPPHAAPTPRATDEAHLTPETVARFDRPGPRYTSYPTVPHWTDAFDREAHHAALEEAAGDPAPLSLYVHIPFCRKLCLFCGCNTYITRNSDRPPAYLDTLLKEAEKAAAHLAPRREIAQLHLGGGTPTHLAPEQLDALLTPLLQLFPPRPDAERALEAHPAVTTEAHIETLGRHGFNRLSMGVQDFDPLVQKTVGRIQSVEETRRIVDAARDHGFDGVNLDLMYGLPHQRPETWARTLDAILGLRPDRIALFSYAHLPRRFRHQAALPEDAMPSPVEKVALFLQARERLLAEGYTSIGFDHFARHDDELAVAYREGRLQRNFMGYTTRAAPDLIGLGPSAISDVAGRYVQNEHDLFRWHAAVETHGLATERGIRASADDRARRDAIETFLCRFRLDPEALRRTHGDDGEAVARAIEAQAPGWVQEGLVVPRKDHWEATALGRLFARNVAMGLDAYLGGDRTTQYSRTV